ncbi:glycosyltransferase [Halomonas halocynthiae]|uniref:glycosyltransferase n=1 Tax=Halomonas halocynthiae TaxID=176290 RepID=UPI0004173539|nr:glycosyltransferase [Halomonas halocynthiae]
MRTLVVVRSLKMGGMERVAVNLADAFAEAGHDSHLLSLRKVANPLRPERAAVTQHLLPLNRWARYTGVGVLFELIARLLLNPLLKRSVYLGTGIMGGAVFWLWLKVFERKYGKVDRIVFRGAGTFEQLWTFRDSRGRYVLENVMQAKEASGGRRFTASGGVGWLSSLGRKLFGRCLLHKRDLVAVSSGVADSLREAMKIWHFQPASLQVITNPCPLQSIRQRMLEPQPDIPNEPYLVSVGRLVPAKDHALLLRAYARSGVRLPLVLIGDGQERQRLQSLADELEIADRTIFAGQQDNPYPWMHQARLFVLTSRFEGMGIVLFEALACGTPVISVDCPGGIRDILKGELENNIVVRSEDALAEGLRQHVSGSKPPIRDAWLDDFLPERVAEAFLES